MKEKTIAPQIMSSTMLLEVICKPSSEKLAILRGGNPQMPQTLFVGSLEDFSKYVLTI